jgi:MATE family multidrug resistance protein
VSIFCIGVIAAVGTLVAIRQGAGDIDRRHPPDPGRAVAGLADGAGAGLLLWNLKPVLLLFGQTETNVHSAGQFLTPCPSPCPAT